MRVMIIAVLVASSSGCLAHERPDEVDAAVTPDAFVGRDAHDAYVTPDAYAHDSNFPPLQQCNNDGRHGPHWDIELLACTVGEPSCLAWEVDTASGGTFWSDRCARGSTQTVLRATLLAASSTSNGIDACLENAATCTTTAMTNVGDVVEVAGHTEDGGEIWDRFRFFGEGARFQVEVCAIGPCP